MNTSVQETEFAGTCRGACLKYAPLGLFVLALAVRALIVITSQFDGLYGQDGFAYLECAQQILDSRDPCRDFYWPFGYPALAALFMLGTHGTPLGAQLASLLAGAAIAPLTYWAVIAGGGTGAGGTPAGATAVETAIGATSAANRSLKNSAIAAGLIAAFCGQLILSSIVIMSDAPGLFWATLAACLLLQWRGTADGDRGHRLLLPAAAVALALATSTRWIFGGLLLPFGVFALIVVRRKGRAEYLVLVQGVLLLSCVLCAQLYWNTLTGATLLHHSWVVNWNLDNAWHRSFDNPDGHFDFRVPPFIFDAAPIIHPLYLCPL